MKVIVCWFSFVVLLFACSGACLNCHPKLLKEGSFDKDHAILRTCIRCHSEHNTGNAQQCGADCWECHNIKSLSKTPIVEHQGLENCVACHLKLSLQKAPRLEATPFLDFK